MNRLPGTPSQTVGPFLSIGMSWPQGEFVVPLGSPGAFWLRGRVYDGAGDPVPDGVIETWQADQNGEFSTGGFGGLGRSLTGVDGGYAIYTVKPGQVGDGTEVGLLQAPHLDVSVLARGLLNRVVTRVYFADEVAANAADPVLAALSKDEQATLTALLNESAEDGSTGYTLDIRLQGAAETVFFRV